MSILQDKIVLVTGAGAGIGRATALGMAEVGATVAAADIDLAAAQRTNDQAASKGAVISLTWMAAQQLGRHNINVNAICPGVTRTELGARNAVERAAERGITVAELNAEAEARIPIGRANQPEDIAAMAVFLASPAARNITGQAYNVDGGLVPS